MNKREKREKFRKAALQLADFANLLADAATEAAIFVDVNDPRVTGIVTKEPLYSIKALIDDTLASFDQLQRALGLPPGFPARHEHFLKGIDRRP
jgi:hypothetical protein